MATNPNGTIRPTTPGSDESVYRPVSGFPSGVTVTSALMGVKLYQASTDTLRTKTVLPGYVAGVGGVLDTGISGVAIVQFDWTGGANGDTIQFIPGHTYYYYMKYFTSTGEQEDFELGDWPMLSGGAAG